MPSSPSAATITVLQTLDLLDGPFSDVVQGFIERRYVLWLGSGISRNRVPDLLALIRRVLEHLHARAKFGDSDCPYFRALSRAVNLAELSAEESKGFDPSVAVASWGPLPTILDRLRNKYSRLLDIRIDGQPPDYLLWNAIDVVNTFADPAIAPDCEHLCIGMLVMEGAIGDVVSANWDGLIESAIQELTAGATDVLRKYVRPEDFRESALRARLAKLHGCAALARADSGKYRALLIGRESQIADWPHNVNVKVMRNYLEHLATVSPTLMIGLSAQDQNIKSVFLAAKEAMKWNWPAHPPAYVFAEDTLGADQELLLKCVYRDAFETAGANIETSSLIRAYAKQLLTALMLELFSAKLRALARHADAKHLSGVDFTTLGVGITCLRNAIAQLANVDPLAFVRAFIRHSSSALSLFREGRPTLAGSAGYRALTGEAVNQVGNSPELSTSGLPEMSACIGLLGLGVQDGKWTIEFGNPEAPETGVINMTSAGGGKNKVFFAANSDAATQLYVTGIVREDAADAVVIYSTAPVERMRRAPRAAIGRTGVATAREVSMRAILRDATDLAVLQQRFREEALI